MPGPRLLAPFLLAAAAVAGIALATSALDAPGRAEPLPLPSPAPGDVTTAFTSEADLHEFARAAYHDLSREDWPALLRSLLSGDYGADPCAPGTLAARAAAGVRRAALEIEAALAAGDALHAQRVALPQPEWRVAAVELGDGEAWITRRARAYGRDVAPPVVRRDRWAVAGGEWWLDPASLAPDAGEDAPADGCPPADDGAVRASPESAFARPLPSGATVEAETGAAALAITLTAGERGGGPPAPPGYEYAEFTARVESRDGAQLGAPLAFRSATYDGWLLGGVIPVSTAICPGTEDSGVTCHLTTGRALVAAHDPAPRIAWTPAARPGERASGAAWWRLPTLIRDGKPAVRDLSPETLLPLQGAGGQQAGVPSGVWATDFTRAAVDLAQIAGEGATRGGASALVLAGAGATPSVYDSIAEADAWLADAEPVLAVEAGGAARAYPLRLLLWRPVVNDELRGEPVLVTFSPLTNTAAAYERRTGIAAPEFRATGALRFRNALLYDAPTESWWQQATGDALAGDLAGLRLAPLPGIVLSWADFRAAYPNGDALSINAGFAGDFDFNPYFDVDFSPPDRLRGADLDPRLNAHARVLGVRAGGGALAFPYTDLALDGAVHAELGGEPVVVFWRRGTASALSSVDIASGRDVGSSAAYDPRIDGAALTFTAAADGAAFVDAQTGSRWDLTGRAVSGPLEGRRLRPVPAQTTSFWFAWAALHPETAVYRSARRAS